MEAAAEILRYTTIAALVILAGVTFVQWRRGRHPGSRWAFFTFLVLALISVAGLIQPDDLATTTAGDMLLRVEVGILVLFPFFLYLLSTSFKRGRRITDFVAVGVTAGVIAWGFMLPDFPQGDEVRPRYFVAYIGALLAQWTLLSVLVAVRFWRAGRGQTSVARTRMRMLAIASITLSAVLIVSGSTPGSDRVAQELATRSITLVSVLAFFLAFAPPRFLRTIWRRPVEDSLRQGTVDLMSATSEEEVTGFLFPSALSIVGGEAIAVIDEHGSVVASSGFQGASLEEARLLLNHPAANERDRLGADLVTLRFAFGWLLVRTGPYTTYFGREEIELLGALGALASLAIERIRAEDLKRQLARANVRREQALEINDNVVQGLAVAKYALDLGHTDKARSAIEGTLAAARKIITDLIDELGEGMELGPGTLARGRAASGFHDEGEGSKTEAG